jgi:CBS domain-containing protein
MVADAGSLTVPVSFSRLEPMNTTLAWLGSVNIMIGFFNLIPAFPLDGGRIVRSLIWAVLDDIRRSTRWATRIGQGIAWTMVVTGAVMVFGVHLPFLGGAVFNGLWLIFIGIFLQHAAVTGYRQAVIEDKLATVPVRNVMQTSVPVISSNASLGELLKMNLTQPDGHTIFVTENHEIVGLVTMREVKRSLMDNRPLATVGDIMTPVSDLHYVSADEDVIDAFERLQRFDMRQIPVMFNNRIVGLLHRKDVHRLLQLPSELIS